MGFYKLLFNPSVLHNLNPKTSLKVNKVNLKVNLNPNLKNGKYNLIYKIIDKSNQKLHLPIGEDLVIMISLKKELVLFIPIIELVKENTLDYQLNKELKINKIKRSNKICKMVMLSLFT